MTKHGAEWHGASDGLDPFERSRVAKVRAELRAAVERNIAACEKARAEIKARIRELRQESARASVWFLRE